MRFNHFLVVTLLLTVTLFSCKKEDDGGGSDIKPEDVAKANEFKAYVASKKFQIADGGYYADKPIDYVEDDDVVKAETDLWPYVSLWLKDDYNMFDLTTNKVTIQQNTHKIPGNDAEQIVKDISVGADKDGVYFNFLNYLYEPLKYRLVEFTPDHFLVYVNWHSGAKVYTKFAVLPE